MMPICCEKGCYRTATMKVGLARDMEIRGNNPFVEPIYMCTKHAEKFIKKYGVWDD